MQPTKRDAFLAHVIIVVLAFGLFVGAVIVGIFVKDAWQVELFLVGIVAFIAACFGLSWALDTASRARKNGVQK